MTLTLTVFQKVFNGTFSTSGMGARTLSHCKCQKERNSNSTPQLKLTYLPDILKNLLPIFFIILVCLFSLRRPHDPTGRTQKY